MDVNKYRKYKDNLVTSGFAVIAFSIWSMLRVIIKTVINQEFIEKIIIAGKGELNNLSASILVLMMIIIIFSLSILLHTYIGVSARREGKGIKKGKIYPILAFLLMINIFLGTIDDIFQVMDETNAHVEAISILVDVASLYAISNLVYSLYKVRKYERKMA